MKKIAFAILAVVFMFSLMLAPAPASAEDQLLTAKISSVVQAKDKNGNAYTRVIIEEQKELNGVKYTTGVPVMFFGDMAAKGAQLKTGGTFKGIVSSRDFNGRTSYTAHALVQ